MKILFLDVETAPNLAHVWQFWNTNVGANQVMEHSTMLSYAAKWLGEDRVYYSSVENQSEKAILKSLNTLLDKADCTVAHNGNKFERPLPPGCGHKCRDEGLQFFGGIGLSREDPAAAGITPDQ